MRSIWWGILVVGCGSTVAGVTGDPSAAPQCTDKAKSGDETDVDCGGSCGPCDAGKGCVQFGDCKSKVCNAGTCANQCTDQMHDADETDIDCGGSCDKCADGRKCSTPSDCQSGMCNGGTCGPGATCTDGAKTGNETDVDCGGACPKCSEGKVCKTGSDCQNTNCSNGLCCGTKLGNCDANAATGCETSLDSDPKNCGKCGAVCGATAPACASGKCEQQLMIKVEGHADVAVGCAKGDYQCQAKQVCEKITKVTCVYQQYDCYLGTQAGSYYPLDGSGGLSALNFAYSYDFTSPNNDFGNICACDPSYIDKYGMASTHTKCGYGHWFRQ